MVQANRLAEKRPYGGKAAWEAEELEGRRGAARCSSAQDWDVLARFDAENMWLRAAYFLRRGYWIHKDGDEEWDEEGGNEESDGDRMYRDFRSWHELLIRQEPAAPWENLETVDVEMAEAKRTGNMPRFEAVAMVSGAPLI